MKSIFELMNLLEIKLKIKKKPLRIFDVHTKFIRKDLVKKIREILLDAKLNDRSFEDIAKQIKKFSRYFNYIQPGGKKTIVFNLPDDKAKNVFYYVGYKKDGKRNKDDLEILDFILGKWV